MRLAVPLIGLLVATVLVVLVMMMQLRSGAAGVGPGLGAYRGAISAAHHAAALEASPGGVTTAAP